MRPTRTYSALAIFAAAALLSTPPAHADIMVARGASGFSRPVFVTAPPGDTTRLVVFEEHTGRVMILNRADNTIKNTPLLDLARIANRRENGLLGFSFHPDYANNGRFYVNISITDGTTHIRDYLVSDNPNITGTETDDIKTVLTYNQPQTNRNGGWLDFGPDAYPYIASGDGGDDNDAGHTPAIGNAQHTTDNLLGQILRIDGNGLDSLADHKRNYTNPGDNPFVDKQGDDEIWSYGLRILWRSSFD